MILPPRMTLSPQVPMCAGPLMVAHLGSRCISENPSYPASLHSWRWYEIVPIRPSGDSWHLSAYGRVVGILCCWARWLPLSGYVTFLVL